MLSIMRYGFNAHPQASRSSHSMSDGDQNGRATSFSALAFIQPLENVLSQAAQSKALVLIGFAFGISAWTSQALADSENSISASDQSYRSPGQVDMRTGYFQHERVDAAIGPQDGGDGLSLLRAHAPFDYTDGATNNIVWDGPFAMTHNWSMRLYENRILARPLPDQSTDFEHRENRRDVFANLLIVLAMRVGVLPI